MTPAIILSVASIAVGAAGAWTVQAWRYEAQIADIQRTHDQAVATAQAKHINALEQAREQTAKHQQQAHKAAEDAANRVAAADTAMRRNRDELGRLRDATKARASTLCLPNTSTTSPAAPADTVGDVLGECGEALTDMARAADGHVSDVQMMRDAWPR